MYKAFDGKSWIEFNTYNELVNYLAQFNRSTLFRGMGNSFLDKTGSNPNDICYVTRVNGSIFNGVITEVQSRTNRVLCDNTSIYGPQLIKDVENWKFSHDMLRESQRGNGARKVKYYQGHFWRLPDSAYPEFRRGPMPFVHHRHYGGVYRHIRTTNERRQSAIPEYKDFIRKSRGENLPDLYFDDPIRDWRNSGWKKQGKRRHQWENGVINREKHQFGKGVYVEKKRKSNIELTCDDFE